MSVDDHYKDDKKGKSVPDKGWEKDIMGAYGAPVTSKSIAELIQKNKLDCDCGK
jgi:hypothetical protein